MTVSDVRDEEKLSQCMLHTLMIRFGSDIAVGTAASLAGQDSAMGRCFLGSQLVIRMSAGRNRTAQQGKVYSFLPELLSDDDVDVAAVGMR